MRSVDRSARTAPLGAHARGNTGLALVLLFAFGLLIGVSVSMTVIY